MTTATKPEAEETLTASQPKNGNLQIRLPASEFDLPAELSDELGGYLHDATAFEEELAECNAAFRELANAGGTTQIKTLATKGEAIAEEREKLQQRKVELTWRRYELVRRLAPALADQEALAKQELEAGIAAARARLAEEGVSEKGLEIYGRNPTAAIRQFYHKCKEEPEAMRAQERLSDISAAASAAKGILPPTFGAAEIKWPRLTGARETAIALLSGVDRPRQTKGVRLSDQAERICNEVGLGVSPILPEHAKVLEELGRIATMVVARPLHNISAEQFERALPLIERLPKTTALGPLRTHLRASLPHRR